MRSSLNARIFRAASLREKTRAEALANIKDAMEGYLASLEQHKEPIPPPVGDEIVEVSLKQLLHETSQVLRINARA